MSAERSGILAGGNFIVDHVKVIDAYPAEDMLANILSASRSNGGGPFNVLKDLAAMGAGFPLAAVGMVGADADGDWIRNDCRTHGIDITQLHTTEAHATSYTDAMTVRATGRRTFFHQRGANAALDEFDFAPCGARLFHLAYLMLLDSLDAIGPDGLTGAARVLRAAKRAGMETSADVVSTEHPDFRRIASSALPFTDHLVINEVETARIVGRAVPADDPAALTAAARELLDLGVQRAAVIHTAAGAAAASRDGHCCTQSIVRLPAGFSRGATGAGDAFAAGYLYALHEGQPLQDRLRLAVCAAAASLSHPTASGGLAPAAECHALGERFGFGRFDGQ